MVVEEKLLAPAKIGKQQVKVVHLQYADDTIFMCTGKTSNFRVMKVILLNFGKCSLHGINTDEGVLIEVARYLGCSVSSFLITYLGLNIGTNHQKSKVWEGLVLKMRRRLAK
ncbi:hypothetical protein ACS0TY_029458 [Phlomoides rotata]